jgi:F-type H+-transporting ATPase subunit delta
MFKSDRWAAAFTGSLGKDADLGLEALKAISAWAKGLSGEMFGSACAARFEALVEKAAKKAKAESRPVEISRRFTALLIRHHLFDKIDSVISEIEKIQNKAHRIITLYIESAQPLDAAAEDEICRQVKLETGAAQIKTVKKLAPELLGGYRLRIGDDVIDASARLQLQRMGRLLAAKAQGGQNG